MKHTLLLGIFAACCSLTAAAQGGNVTDSLPAGARVAPWASPAARLASDTLLSPPQSWSMTPVYPQTSPSEDLWWNQFDDPVLRQLISKAENSNFNIRIALRRMETARQQIQLSKAGYYPTVQAAAGYTVERSAGAVTSPAHNGTTLNYINLGLSASWEIDLFGRISEQLKADKASLSLSRADYDAAMIALCSEVAKAYVNLRVLQAQLALARSHTESQQKIVDMTLARQEAGLASALEVAQARQVLYSTQAGIPNLEADIECAMGAIAVLTGEYPEDAKSLLSTPRPLPDVYVKPCVGTPLEMLRRRPDIAQDEAQMAVYAAQAGIAKKDYLPVLTLTGSVGVQAHKPDDLFSSRGFTYSVAPTLSWTIFDGMARKYRTSIAREQMELGIDSYNQTLLNAVQEVDNYAADYDGYLRQISLLDRLVEESEKAYDLAVDLYRSTLTPFSNVVDAQMNLLAYQNDVIAAQGNALSALISLYQALGGGW